METDSGTSPIRSRSSPIHLSPSVNQDADKKYTIDDNSTELNDDFNGHETLKEETKHLPDVQALKVKDSNKKNDFSSQFLNFINDSQQDEADEIDTIMKDEDVDKANDNEVELTENKKTEEKPVTKKPDSPGSSDKENKVEKRPRSTESKIASSDQNLESPRQEKPRRKLNDFIADKSLRVRSFLRRRPIPLKRLLELDIQCGTHSFALQANAEVEEVVYCGSKELVDCFLSRDGLKVSDVNSLIVAAKYQARPKGRGREWEHDYDPAQEGGEEEEDGDEEFFDTVKSKKKKAALARAESAKRMAEVEYLKHPSERFKRFKCSKDGVLSKIKEIDSVCGSKSFVVIVNTEKECAYYQGDPDWVSEFFTVGVKRRHMDPSLNVRPFLSEEVEYNVCRVPQCIVSLNTLGKWRLAAIDMYKFPADLPMTLYACSEEDKGGWMAEIDVDPESKGKVVVCSLHFRDGIPTAENPSPTELLGEKGGPTDGCTDSQVVFRGKRAQEEEKTEEEKRRLEGIEVANEIVEGVLREVEKEIEKKAQEERKRKEKEEKRRKEIAALKTVKFLKFNLLKKKPGKRKSIGKLKKKTVKVRKKNVIETRTKFSMEKRVGGKIKYKKVSDSSRYRTIRTGSVHLTCRFCPSQFSYTRAYFQHVRTVHVAPIRKKKELNVTKGETRKALTRLYPSNGAQLLDAKKKYVCAVCKSVCDLYGLFLHMKQVHRGILCQYCLKLFKKVRDLDSHLAGVHKVPSRYYHNSSQLAKYSGTHYSFICSGCSEMVEFSQLDGHVCGGRKSFDCPWCRESQASQEELESHIVNEWCPRFDQKQAPSPRDVQILYKILTGNTLELQEEDCLNTTDIGINALLEVDIGGKKDKGETKEEQPQKRRGPVFSCADRNVLVKYVTTSNNIHFKDVASHCILEDLPLTGTIYSGPKSKAITSTIKKELKDLGTKLDLEAEVKKTKASVDVSEEIKELNIERAGKNFLINTPSRGKSGLGSDIESDGDLSPTPTPTPSRISLRITSRTGRKSRELSPPPTPISPTLPVSAKEPKPKAETKQERVVRLSVEIDNNTARLRDVVEHFSSCLFCQQCRMVSVDTQFLLSHLLVVHSEHGVVELLKEEPKDCITRLKRFLRDTRQKELMFRYQGDGEEFTLEYYRCSYCPTQECTSYSALFIHTAEAHNTKVLTCNICQNIFLNYGSLISHVCSGPPTTATARARFFCKVCNKPDLSSFLDFQHHVRKEHHFCEICFTPQTDQSGLYEHCAQHEQDLMCMKCFVTFERYESFRKHLFWKHGPDAISCDRCHTPTWPHVYHFCLPQLPVVCETCDMALPNAAAYRVHKRTHTGLTPHTCPACSRSFISKSLLWKHQSRRHADLKQDADKELNKRKLRKDMIKYDAKNEDTLDVVRSVVEQWMEVLMEKVEPVPPPPSPPKIEIIKKPEVSVLDAAIRSIMPESEEEMSPRKLLASPIKPLKPPPGSANHDAVQATIAGQTYTADTCWQAGIDALLAGASIKGARVSELPPTQLFQTPESEGADRKRQRSGTESESGEDKAPVMGGLWNQDLLFINKNPPAKSGPPGRGGARVRGGVMAGPGQFGSRIRGPAPAGVGHMQGGPRVRGTAPMRGGIRVLKPSSDGSGLPSPTKSPHVSPVKTEMLLNGVQEELSEIKPLPVPHLARHGQWDLDLSEESSDDAGGVKKPAGLKQRSVMIQKPLQDHDYCYAAWMMNQQMQQLPNNEPSEIDKIVSNVAFGGYGDAAEHSYMSPKFGGGASPSPKLGGGERPPTVKKEKKRKKKKDKKKKKRRRDREGRVHSDNSSSDSEDDIDVVGRSRNDTPVSVDMFGIQARQNLGVHAHNFLIPSANVQTEPNPAILNIPVKKKRGRPRKGEIVIKTPKIPQRRGPKPKYHTPVDVAKARGVVAGTARPSFETDSSGHESGSDREKIKIKEPEPPSDSEVDSSDFDTDFSANEEELIKKVKEVPKSIGKVSSKPALKLKIKLPPLPAKSATPDNKSAVSEAKSGGSEAKKSPASTPKARPRKKKRRRSNQGANNEDEARPLSKKMRESLALNQRAQSSSSGSDRDYDDDDEDDDNEELREEFAVGRGGPVPGYGEVNDKLYCYCQSPHDDVSEMIGCDAPDCRLEWFHFECVGIMIPPEGKWYCPECTKRYGLG